MTGAGCALLGESGAMACTVAVEDLVTKHYDDQVLASLVLSLILNQY